MPIPITTDEIISTMNVLTLEIVRATTPDHEAFLRATDQISERLLAWAATLDTAGTKAALADLGHMLSGGPSD